MLRSRQDIIVSVYQEVLRKKERLGKSTVLLAKRLAYIQAQPIVRMRIHPLQQLRLRGI